MKLYVLRHARAVDRLSPDLGKDSDRPLTPGGRKKMQRIAEGLRRLGLAFDLILSSPFRRAHQTAAIVADVFACPQKLKFTDALAAGQDPVPLVKELQQLPRSCQRVMLVGHEPDLSRLVSLLITGKDQLRLTWKKGGLVQLTVDTLRPGQCAAMDWMLAPRHLVRLAAAED